MTSEEIYARLTPIFRKVFDDPELEPTPEMVADDVEAWDSLSHIRLILSVEKAFHINFSTAEIGRAQNVGEFVGMIRAKLTTGNA